MFRAVERHFAVLTGDSFTFFFRSSKKNRRYTLREDAKEIGKAVKAIKGFYEETEETEEIDDLTIYPHSE